MAALVGIYYAYKDRGRKSIENYNYGGRDVSPVGVLLHFAKHFVGRTRKIKADVMCATNTNRTFY